jgi:phospholipid transport system transporter-binding protein
MTLKFEKRENDNCIELSGHVHAEDITEILEKGEVFFSNVSQSILLDLEGLESANSIILSLLLSWLRLAKRKHLDIKIMNMSNQLHAMARVSGLESFLPVK